MGPSPHPEYANGPVKADAPEQPLVAVTGPTGSGKSGLALELAELFHGEIVNCDSLQVYRHFDIGTAKLRIEECRGQRLVSRKEMLQNLQA